MSHRLTANASSPSDGQVVLLRGEAGIGYVLASGFDLPPLMFTADEVDAVALGAQWVAGHADPALARAAHDVLAKLAAVFPKRTVPLGDTVLELRHQGGTAVLIFAMPRYPAATVAALRLARQVGLKAVVIGLAAECSAKEKRAIEIDGLSFR